MQNHILILNAGSSSIKFALYQVASANTLELSAEGQIEGIGIQPHLYIRNAQQQTLLDQVLKLESVKNHAQSLGLLLIWLQNYLGKDPLIAVGHRVVHGGHNYIAPVILNPDILADLQGLESLAPLHQAHNLAPISSLNLSLPELPQVACFDTAFHHTQPDTAKCLALPRHFAAQGILRYGFHGLSYEYIAQCMHNRTAEFNTARVIVAHLGNGASLCAMRDGVSIATTMGFSPLDGIVMGTRCGALDPGVILHLLQHYAMDASSLENLLYHQSGLLGISGISSDMRVLLNSEEVTAQEAIAVFVYRIIREIGSLTAALGGLDTLIFTGGIGENSAIIREKICAQSHWLGIALEHSANNAHAPCISAASSKVAVWVIPSNENLMIAQHTLRLISA